MTQTTSESSTDRRLVKLTRQIVEVTPKGVPAKPEDPDGFEGPVAWLGGRELVASLKLILLYSLFGGKLDSRDWMTGIVNLLRVDGAQAPDSRKAEAKEGVYIQPIETWRAAGEPAAHEFWFDYVADSGDGQMPTYNIAYLCMRHLHLATKEGEQLLPRGKFLFIGGDTAYHVADYETLAKRFQAPFWWAYKDLVCEGEIPEAEMSKRRPVFAIPGNHDYYDALDGFNRQFRRPSTGEDDESSRDPLLQLPTFERHQEASYVALRLPFNWWLWGLDIERSEIDFRQETFFKKVHQEYKPKKLIIATPSPTTVFGKYLDKDKPLTKVFKAIGLKRPFLKGKEKEELEPGECRLDLSGDVHHYARYWGPKTDGKEKPRGGQDKGRPYDKNYASVISGGGGAFFDPTNTYLGEIEEQVLYPTVSESLTAMSKEILDFSNIRKGGFVHYLGGFMAFLICFAAIIAPNPPEVVFLRSNPLPANSIITLGFGSVLISLSLLILGNVVFKKAFKRIDERIDEQEPDTENKQERVQKKIAVRQTIVICLFLLATVLFMVPGIVILRSERPFLPLSDSLLIFLTTVWAGLMAILYLQYTERLNGQANKRPLTKWLDYGPTWSMLFFGALAFCCGFWFFGQSSWPASLLADIAFMTVVTVLTLGLIIGLAWGVGAERHGWKGKIGYVVMGSWHTLLQLTVPVLWTLSVYYLFNSQDISTLKRIFTPKGIWLVLLPVFILLVAYWVFRWIGIRFVDRNDRKRLFATWIVFGLVMIGLPALYLYFLKQSVGLPHTFIQMTYTLLHMSPWKSLGLCIVAAIIGVFMSCVWFGWYLAVALLFNGHNNEAGGAARLQGYKQFMRIRLRQDDLTAYVIGFDKAQPEGTDLIPTLRLIDQFTLTVKSN